MAETVTPQDVDYSIKSVDYSNHGLLTVCVVTMQNGYKVTGESGCADPAKYDEALGQKLALGKAKDKIWALLGYQLREKLFMQSGGVEPVPPSHLDRLVNEFDELKVKRVKLRAFIYHNDMFKSLAQAERRDLERQETIMGQYLGVLHDRLVRAGVPFDRDGFVREG